MTSLKAHSSTTILHLAKQNFKFSAAHFLIFNEQEAERLHGHNYQVQVDITSAEASEGAAKEQGYFVDFKVLKKFIKSRIDAWDEVVLLPASHPDMKIEKQALPQGTESLRVNFRDRLYVFPANEVVLLPINNTSVETLSLILAKEFLLEFSKYGVQQLRVYVEESAGQGAWTEVKA